MVRPLNREQRLENRAFLTALAASGNARDAARTIGVAYGTMQYRRSRHPDFALRWDAALATAQARLAKAGGAKRPSGAWRGDSRPGAPDPNGAANPRADQRAGARRAHRTRGGEPVVVQRRDGTLQLRRAQPGKLTRACEQAFLAALSATANVRLSAAAAGASVAAFYRRRRCDPGFAREMRDALALGYERLEMALLASFEVEAAENDDWRHNEPPPIPSMTPEQALQLLYLHHKTVNLWAEAPYMRRRRGETAEDWSIRRAADYTAEQARQTERLKREATDRALNAALRRARLEPPPPDLPALDQVTGWSKADPDKTPHNPRVALFGGWRIEDMEKRGR